MIKTKTTALVPVKNSRIGKIRVATPRGVSYVESIRAARKVALKGLAPGEHAEVTFQTMKLWGGGRMLRTFYYLPEDPRV